MLIATDKDVFELDEQDLQAPPHKIVEGSPTAILAGRTRHAVALDDGRILVLQAPVRDHPEITTIATGLDKPIVSLWWPRERATELLLGTDDEAMIYRIEAGAARRVESFAHLSCRDGWNTPWGGPPAVRTLAGTPDGWVYADIHVGSIMRSHNAGIDWAPVTPDLNRDVHQVATTPGMPDRVVANTAAAVYVSDDRGETWHDRGEPLGKRYGRSVAVAPDEPDRMLAGVSDGPHGEDVRAQLYLTTDAGKTWRHVTDGYPDSAPENINTNRLAWAGGGVGFASEASRLYVSEDGGESWQVCFDAEREIERLSPTPTPA